MIKMEAYGYYNIDQAIKKLQTLKKHEKKCKILIYTIDYDQNEESEKLTTPDEGCELVKKAKSIFFNEGEVFEHMQLFSTSQSIEHITRAGIMHDITLPHLRE
jgi:hypothetical protein